MISVVLLSCPRLEALEGIQTEDLSYLVIIAAHIDQLQPECEPDDRKPWQKSSAFKKDAGLISKALALIVANFQGPASDILLEKEDEFFKTVEAFESRLGKEVGDSWPNDGRRITVKCADEQRHRGKHKTPVRTLSEGTTQ